MCGILGSTVASPLLQGALQLLGHRGPDAQAIWCAPSGVSLGHTRLSIIDLDASANQPMSCARTGNVIVFNGEIYNYRGLRHELEALGWVFRTRSDTEVLLASYGQWGTDCFERLQGMFGLAIFDQSTRRVVLARDRMGKKPLYYSLAEGQLAWASEIKALLKLRPSLRGRGRISALRTYLDLGYVAGNETIYADIQKLPPGYFGTFNVETGNFALSRYWRLPCPQSGVPMTDEEADARLETLLVDAVKLRLESDVPLGMFLSGGLDSSIVAALANELKPGMVAYTARFAEARFDESETAARVAKHLGLKHRIFDVDERDGSVLEHVLRNFDEPFADSSLLPTYLISKRIRDEVTVALSGDGGDELFAGYDVYHLIMSESAIDRVPSAVRTCVSKLHHLLQVGTPGKNLLRRLAYGADQRYLFLLRSPEHQPFTVLRHDLQDALDKLEEDAVRKSRINEIKGWCGSPTILQLMTLVDAMSYLPDDVLAKVDRASMLASLEVRCPLLDHNVVEFAYRLPDRLRYRAGVRKYILKLIGRRMLPSDFPFERKRGFSIPEGDWIRGRWKAMFEEKLCSCPLLNEEASRRLLDLHEHNGRYGRMLFKLFALAVFEQDTRLVFE